MANKITKFMAVLALVGIIIGIVGTGILFIVEKNRAPKQIDISKEEMNEIIKKVEKEKGSGETVITSSGNTDSKVSSGSISK